MALYQVDRSNGISRRPCTCIQEHLSSQEEYIECNKMKRNSFILPDHLKKYSMTRPQEQLHKKDRQRKRTERQGQNDIPTSEHRIEEQHCRIASRECEMKQMDVARAARSQIIRRAKGDVPKNANQNVQQ